MERNAEEELELLTQQQRSVLKAGVQEIVQRIGAIPANLQSIASLLEEIKRINWYCICNEAISPETIVGWCGAFMKDVNEIFARLTKRAGCWLVRIQRLAVQVRQIGGT